MVELAETWGDDLDHDDNEFMFKCETNHQRFESFLKLNGLVDHD
jgi:hypothetical protein